MTNSQGNLRITVRASPPGNQSLWAPYSSQTPQAVELPGEHAIPYHEWPVVSFGAPAANQMSIAASEAELQSSGGEDSAALPPGKVALSEPELPATLSRATERVGLEWNPSPCPVPSRLDDWYLGVGRAGSQHPATVPFLHEEVTRSWTAPFSARNRATSCPLTTLDGVAAMGFVGIPPV